MSRLVTVEEIRRLARQSRSEKRLSQYAAAAELNVGREDIEGAEHTTGGEYLELQLRMIREIGGYDIEGPLYRIEEPAGS